MAELVAHMTDVARRVVASLPDDNIAAATLYGSVAWGDANEASDIDIMLLLDRDDHFHEVTRRRVRDLLPNAPDVPVYADLVRISYPQFLSRIDDGGWHPSVARCIVLRDDGRFAPVRERVSANYWSRRSRRARAEPYIALSRDHAAAALRATDDALATLLARQAAEEAAVAVLQAHGNRRSVSHLLQGTERALAASGRSALAAQLRVALDLTDPAAADRGMAAYRVIAETLREWMADPETAERLGPEQVAWAEFSYSDESYGEFAHKIDAQRRVGRFAESVSYVDGLLKVPLRIDTSKVLSLRASGTPDRLSIPDFHAALRDHPHLYDAWVAGLRLGGADVAAINAVAEQILASVDDVLAAQVALITEDPVP